MNGGTFTGNTAPAGDGGAIYENAGEDGVQVTGTFTANTALAGCGGAIFDFDADDDSMASSSTRNKAGSGGALCLNPQFGTSFSGVISGNSASRGRGAASTPSRPWTSVTAHFPGTTPAQQAAALWTSAGGGEPAGVSADGTTFSGNSAPDGGGIFNSAISLDLNNDSIYDNQASAHGGGLYNEGPNNSGEDFSPAALVSTVISGNWASRPAAVASTTPTAASSP